MEACTGLPAEVLTAESMHKLVDEVVAGKDAAMATIAKIEARLAAFEGRHTVTATHCVGTH